MGSLVELSVYVDVTDCRPSWLTEDYLFGKSKTRSDPLLVLAPDEDVDVLSYSTQGR